MQQSGKRQVVLDTETTGMNTGAGPHWEGHRIIEIGCVELIDRRPTGRTYHQYIQPLRAVDPEAIRVHGITDEFLADKPVFSAIVKEFVAFIDGAELIAHNAPFDVGFMDYEFSMLRPRIPTTNELCTVVDSLDVAKRVALDPDSNFKDFPSRKNLDALAKYFGVDQAFDRRYHGALLDAEILAMVYLQMTGGQKNLTLKSGDGGDGDRNAIRRLNPERRPLKIVKASAEELNYHQESLDRVDKSAGQAIWRALNSTESGQ